MADDLDLEIIMMYCVEILRQARVSCSVSRCLLSSLLVLRAWWLSARLVSRRVQRLTLIFGFMRFYHNDHLGDGELRKIFLYHQYTPQSVKFEAKLKTKMLPGAEPEDTLSDKITKIPSDRDRNIEVHTVTIPS